MKELFDFKAKPTGMWLTLNRGCQMRCCWCYGQCTGFSKSDNMSWTVAKRAINMAKDTGVKSVTLIGGEPTIWSHFFELISCCKENGLKVGVVTNALHFANDNFYKKFTENPCDNIGISVKAGNDIDFKRFTGIDAFRKTNLGIKRALTFKGAGVSTVYSNLLSKEKTLEIAYMSKMLGAEKMVLSLCSSVIIDRKTNEGRFSDEWKVQTDRLVKDIIEMKPVLAEMFDGKILFELYLPLCLFPEDFIDELAQNGQTTAICHMQTRSGIIFDTDGSVLPCNSMIGNRILKLDKDFSDGSTLLAALNSEKLVEDYRLALRYPAHCCSDCSLNAMCYGGCILNWTQLDPSICRAVK